MNGSNTKEKILEVALDLFSEKGYDAVSVNELAKAVGIKAPSLYKHYESKQSIFDELISRMKEVYESGLDIRFSKDTYSPEEMTGILAMTPIEYAETICRHMRHITIHPVISKTRKLLCIEQFRNPKLSEMLENHQYEYVMKYHIVLIRTLAEHSILSGDDIETMALQFMAPITVEMQRVDRNPSLIDEAEEHIRRHVVKFFAIYSTAR